MKLLLNILILISAVAAITVDEMGVRSAYLVLKPLTTVLVLAVPLLFGARTQRKYWLSVVVGLVFCLLGDSLLMFESYFILGLISFLIGHLIFVFGYYSIGGFKLYWLPLVGILIFNSIMFSMMHEGLGDMRIPVMCYMGVISLMGWQGISMYLWQRKFAFLLIAIGACLFIISDSIIAIHRFAAPVEYSGVYILTTYWLAVTLLANSTVFVSNDS